MIDSPDVEGDVLAHVSAQQFQGWEAVEHAASDDSEDVHVQAVGVADGGEVEPFAAFPHLFVD